MRTTGLATLMALAIGLAAWTFAGGSADAQELTFSFKDKQIIASFFGGGGDGGQQGKGKGKGKKAKGVGNMGLPPGLAKKQKLPPGIAKRQLPSTLMAQLAPAPKGFERVIVDNDILLIEIATQLVHDVITDIIH